MGIWMVTLLQFYWPAVKPQSPTVRLKMKSGCLNWAQDRGCSPGRIRINCSVQMPPTHHRFIADLSTPILTLARAVPLDWTDHNAHLTESGNLDDFVNATDRFMELIGCDSDSEGADVLPPKPISGI